MSDFTKKCFVCGKEVANDAPRNRVVNLPVCESCQGTPREKKATQAALETTADGLVCGCIG